MTYDQAQSSRIRQRSGVENPGVRLIHTGDLPEVAYKGQMVYDIDTDFLRIYDGAAWQTIGDASMSVTYVQSSPPSSPNVGDFWLDTDTSYLTVWDGTDWQDPTALVIEDNSVGEDQITAAAMTSKHTITGSVFRTAASGNRIVMRDDGSGGVIQGDSGNGETSYSQVNPTFTSGQPILQLRAGSMTATPGATLLLKGYGSGGTPAREAVFNCQVEVVDLVATNQIGGTAQDAEFGVDGKIKRKTSSRRYKTNIKTLDIDVEKVLSLRAVEFEARDDLGRKRVGFIAEEAAEIGLDEWVYRDEHGHPSGFDYPAWTAALQQMIQLQTVAIAELSERLEALEGRA